MTDVATDPVLFSRRVLGLDLWAHQVEAALATAFITVIAAARRTGKTTTIEALAIWTAFANPGCVVVILSATQDAARRVTESIGLRLSENTLTRSAVTEGWVARIKLLNGSEIISLPASQRQIRGYGKAVRLVVLDEAGFMPGEVWTAARYIALDERARGSRIIIAGTPWGSMEHFFRSTYVTGLNADDPDHKSFNWKHTANPQLDHEYLERMRERVSPMEYAAEVLGEWSDAVGSLFPRALLDSITVDCEVALPW